MTIKKRYFRVVHALFIVLLLIQLLPDKLSGDTYAQYVIWFAVGVEALTLLVSSFIKKPVGLNLFTDIVSFIYGLLIAWTLATAKFNLLKPALFPPPGKVFWRMIGDYETIVTNIFSSVGIILQGYLLALVIAIPLGLPLRYRSAADLPFGLGIRYLFSDLLACARRHDERRYECRQKDDRLRKGIKCRKIHNAVFRHSPGIAAANLYRLQSGTHRVVRTADLG